MRFGLTTPIVTLVPRTYAAWEADAGPVELREIALAADRLGYHHLSCSEHVAIPAAAAARGGRYYDPTATLAYFAALTTRVRLLTHVVVLPYHHPLALAKRYGTLDRLSGGRLILGVGVGTLREEFELLGLAFADRGERYEDGLRALRAALGQREPAYDGRHYRFRDVIVDPCAVQAHVPIWVGGRSLRSLRRALAFGDGWDPFGLEIDRLRAFLDRARDWPAWHARATPLDVAINPVEAMALDDGVGVARAIAAVDAYRQLGATVINLRFRHQSLAHYLELLERFAGEVAPRFAL